MTNTIFTSTSTWTEPYPSAGKVVPELREFDKLCGRYEDLQREAWAHKERLRLILDRLINYSEPPSPATSTLAAPSPGSVISKLDECADSIVAAFAEITRFTAMLEAL